MVQHLCDKKVNPIFHIYRMQWEKKHTIKTHSIISGKIFGQLAAGWGAFGFLQLKILQNDWKLDKTFLFSITNNILLPWHRGDARATLNYIKWIKSPTFFQFILDKIAYFFQIFFFTLRKDWCGEGGTLEYIRISFFFFKSVA